MGRIEWLSEKDKFEAIGYLAKPGVIDMIEATVPKDKLKKFKEEYRGTYSLEFPYVTKAGSKYGYQFRIYLNDTEGCPEFLAEQLDDKYQSRINDTKFIAELVKEYGFQFTKKPQDVDRIRTLIRKKGGVAVTSFETGLRVYADFLYDLSKKMKNEDLAKPSMVQPRISSNSRRTAHNRTDIRSSFTREQLFKLGWLGETYIYQMLLERNEELLRALKIDVSDDYSIEWFNKGVVLGEEWEDKSVGYGCDIVISLEKRDIFIEVKSSKRKFGMFTMTSNEMQKMRDEMNDYYLVKVDYLERLIKDESPEVMVFDAPYNTFFKPEKMKEATFKIEG